MCFSFCSFFEVLALTHLRFAGAFGQPHEALEPEVLRGLLVKRLWMSSSKEWVSLNWMFANIHVVPKNGLVF